MGFRLAGALIICPVRHYQGWTASTTWPFPCAGHRCRRRPPPAAARQAGTTIDVVRAILDEHPAPPQPLTPGQARSAGRAVAALRARLAPRDLDDLYTGQKISPRQLSRQFGTSRNTILALLDEYGIPRRTGPDARPSFPIDRDWLYVDPHRFRRHHPKWHDGLRGENRKWDRLARSTPRNIRTRLWSW